MPSNDLFAPMTDSEKQAKPGADLFAPMSKEELATKPGANQPSKGLLSGAGDVAAGVGKMALRGAGAVGEFVDRYTGAPTRAALYAAEKGENPISAATTQFGADPAKAPTGKDIILKAHLADDKYRPSDVIPGYAEKGKGEHWYSPEKGGLLDPTMADAAGHGVELMANPINFIPAGGIAKLGSKVADAIKESPGLLKKLSSVEEASKVYDPFLKTMRVPGQSVEELANLGTKVNTGDAPAFLEKASDVAQKGMDKTSGLLDKVKEHGPEALRMVGAIKGHIPGWMAAKAVTSPTTQKVLKEIAIEDPAKYNLILNELRQDTKSR